LCSTMSARPAANRRAPEETREYPSYRLLLVKVGYVPPLSGHSMTDR
jgi:hypothetical protein